MLVKARSKFPRCRWRRMQPDCKQEGHKSIVIGAMPARAASPQVHTVPASIHVEILGLACESGAGKTSNERRVLGATQAACVPAHQRAVAAAASPARQAKLPG